MKYVVEAFFNVMRLIVQAVELISHSSLCRNKFLRCIVTELYG